MLSWVLRTFVDFCVSLEGWKRTVCPWEDSLQIGEPWRRCNAMSKQCWHGSVQSLSTRDKRERKLVWSRFSCDGEEIGDDWAQLGESQLCALRGPSNRFNGPQKFSVAFIVTLVMSTAGHNEDTAAAPIECLKASSLIGLRLIVVKCLFTTFLFPFPNHATDIIFWIP